MNIHRTSKNHPRKHNQFHKQKHIHFKNSKWHSNKSMVKKNIMMMAKEKSLVPLLQLEWIKRRLLMMPSFWPIELRFWSWKRRKHGKRSRRPRRELSKLWLPELVMRTIDPERRTYECNVSRRKNKNFRKMLRWKKPRDRLYINRTLKRWTSKWEKLIVWKKNRLKTVKLSPFKKSKSTWRTIISRRWSDNRNFKLKIAKEW